MELFRKKNHLDSEQSFVLQRRMILNEKSNFYVQEAYKTLRTNLNFSLTNDGCKAICLTSGMASEGKSTTILNLAISFAMTGNRVLLVDADMRRPSLSRLLIEKASPGLSNVLSGQSTIENSIRKNIRPQLDVLLSGDVPPNPLELLGSHRMEQMMTWLKAHYDYILFDTPPVTIVSDACVVATHTDGVLFLVRQNDTDRNTVVQGVKQLELSNAKLLGFVMNGVVQNHGKSYKYKYKYGYRYGKYAYESVRRQENQK